MTSHRDELGDLFRTYGEGEVVSVLVSNRAPRHEGIRGDLRYRSTNSLTSALDGGEWSASRAGRFNRGKELLMPIG